MQLNTQPGCPRSHVADTTGPENGFAGIPTAEHGAYGDRVEIGLYTFADVSLDPDGVGPARRLREVVEEIALADEVGLDVFGIGEHHRRD